jgi:hypothetical protein
MVITLIHIKQENNLIWNSVTNRIKPYLEFNRV